MRNKTERIIYRNDLTYLGFDYDAGEEYEFSCPECGDIITIANHCWWETKCSCGFNWDFEIMVIGTKD